ncbi:MAG: ABC transporter ATP-binding protein [Bacteroidia bacterium]
MSRGKYFKIILKGCGNSVYKKFISISIQKAIISLFELVGLAGLFSIITILIEDSVLQQYIHHIDSFFGLGLSKSQFIVIALTCVLLFFGLKNFLSYHIEFKSLKLADRIIKSLNERIIRNFFAKGYWHFNDEKMFNLTHKAFVVPDQFGRRVVVAVWQLISEFTILLFFVILAFSSSFTFSALLIVLSIPVSAFALKKINSKAKTLGQARNEQQPKTARELFDLFTGFIEMKIYNRSEQFIDQYLKSLGKLNKLKIKENRLSLLPKRILEILTVVIIGLIYGFHIVGQKLGFNTNLMVDVSLLGLFGYKVLPGIARIIESMVQLGNTEIVRLTLYQNLERPQQIQFKELDTFKSLSLENINFSFGEKRILKNFSLSINRTDIIGIMGGSGTGKSTLAKIILGLIKADEGFFFINGNETQLHLNDSWQKKFGYIGADSFMLDGTVSENIAFSKENINFKRVNRLLTECQLAEYKNNDINIGEVGSKLSTGLKQRLALARALYQKPEILILDEFSSNLDYKNEDDLLELISSVVKKESTTVIIISHRPRTMRIAKKVYELENGSFGLKTIKQT